MFRQPGFKPIFMRLRSTISPIRTFSIAVFVLLPLLTLPAAGIAQTLPEPESEQLLNGLRILLWLRPGDQDVILKLRIHSGAAFDLAGKSGEMALLGDILFPDPATREYFTEQMQGRLQVTTNYDSLTITLQGRASDFERIVESLRNALVTTQITPENVIKVREGRVKLVKETAVSSGMLADRAIAARLFGDFPYGAPEAGSTESLRRVDRSDLLLARERFLNSNNATLAVIGDLERSRAMRTLRQLLGIWRKGERNVPSTFRQPQPPDTRTMLIKAPADQTAEIRVAVVGLARSDRDCPAANLLAAVARRRWENGFPELSRKPVFARHEAHVLPGMFVMGATVSIPLAAKTLESAKNVLQSFTQTPVTTLELEQAKSEYISQPTKELMTADGLAQAWLDIHTYNLPPLAEQRSTLAGLTAADLQRTASRLFREASIASIALGDSDPLRVELEPHLKLEVIGEMPAKANAPSQPAAKPSTPSPGLPKPD